MSTSDRLKAASQDQRGAIAIPDAPAIPGLLFRRITGRADYPAVARLRQACTVQDRGDDFLSEADVANLIEHAPYFDPHRDMLVGEVGGCIIAMQWTTARILDGIFVAGLRGYVHPQWRRRGLGRALMAHGEAHTQRIAPPEAAGLPAVWQAEASSHETGARTLFRERGYTPFRSAYTMIRNLDEPIPSLPLPPGIEIRPALPSHYRAIWEAEREAFQDAWGYTPWPEEAYQRFLHCPHYDPELWRVAWAGDQVAGMVLSFVNAEENGVFGRRRGYSEDVAVGRPWRRQGLASALLANSLRALKAHGLTEAALGVDAENPTRALELYRRLGFSIASEWITLRRPWADEASTPPRPEAASP